MIKIGSLNISSFKLGGADCSIYLGSAKLYPTEEPTPPQYEGLCKLTTNNGDVIELEGSGELKYGMISSYTATLVSAEIGTLCTNIGDEAFSSCHSLTSVTIPSSVTSISNGAFNSCGGLTSVNIPNSVTSIGSGAFGGCSSITNIEIPNSVTSISSAAFVRCTSLTSVTIGDGVTSISDGVFYNCSGLTSVTVNATTPPTMPVNNVFDGTNNNLVIYVPSASVDAYKAATNWSDYASRIQAIPT